MGFSITLGLDADDTLWENEEMFAGCEKAMRDLLAPWADPDTVDRTLLNHERATLRIYGYGVKGFVLSMLETAVDLSRGAIEAKDVQRIIDWGRDILNAPVTLLPGVAETVALLAESYSLLLLTKGDQHHQRRKIDASGLWPHLIGAEVLDEKDASTYTRILSQHGVDPASFIMIGNSLRSDIEPVLAIGGRGLHIPYHVMWALEESSAQPHVEHPNRYLTLQRFSDIPAAVTTLLAVDDFGR